ncbi:hypothetical protein SNEBB_000944 [Seison nebaliae]|nr:hypothetical protein SNEBB_000944 [Seison nebaliae]
MSRKKNNKKMKNNMSKIEENLILNVPSLKENEKEIYCEVGEPSPDTMASPISDNSISSSSYQTTVSVCQSSTSLLTVQEEQELSPPFPWYGIDIGGTLTKLVYFEPIDQSVNEKENECEIICRCRQYLLNNRAYGSTGIRDEYLQMNNIRLGGRLGHLHFIRFPTSDMTSFIRMCRERKLNELGVQVSATGGGAFKYNEILKDELGLTLHKSDELNSLVNGINFLTKACDTSISYYLDVNGNEHPYDFKHPYPYLLVNVGSGVSVILVESRNKTRRISGSSIGGGTFHGLCCLLCHVDTFEEAIQLAQKGNSQCCDKLVKDIYGGDYDKFDLPGHVVASSFGHMIEKQKRNECSPADLAASVLITVTNNIGSIATMCAIQHSIDHIVFLGNFLRNNKKSQILLSYALGYWSKEVLKAIFFRHEGYFGSVGCIQEFVKNEHGKQQEQQSSDKADWNAKDFINKHGTNLAENEYLKFMKQIELLQQKELFETSDTQKREKNADNQSIESIDKVLRNFLDIPQLSPCEKVEETICIEDKEKNKLEKIIISDSLREKEEINNSVDDDIVDLHNYQESTESTINELNSVLRERHIATSQVVEDDMKTLDEAIKLGNSNEERMKIELEKLKGHVASSSIFSFGFLRNLLRIFTEKLIFLILAMIIFFLMLIFIWYTEYSKTVYRKSIPSITNNLLGERIPSTHYENISLDLLNGTTLTRSATLSAITENGEILLTMRSSNIRSESGTVCLPGGKMDVSDDNNPIITATREAKEEINLRIDENEKNFYQLSPILSISGYWNENILTLIDLENFNLKINFHEVEFVFLVPLELFLWRDGHESIKMNLLKNSPFPQYIHIFKRRVRIFKKDLEKYEEKDVVIWGLTAFALIQIASYIFQRYPQFPIGIDESNGRFSKDKLRDFYDEYCKLMLMNYHRIKQLK